MLRIFFWTPVLKECLKGAIWNIFRNWVLVKYLVQSEMVSILNRHVRYQDLNVTWVLFLFVYCPGFSIVSLIVDFWIYPHSCLSLYSFLFLLFPRVASGIHSFLPEKTDSGCSNETIKQQHFSYSGNFYSCL